MNIQSWDKAAPPTKIAGPILLAGLNRDPGNRDTYNMDHGQCQTNGQTSKQYFPLFLLAAPWITNRKTAVKAISATSPLNWEAAIG